MLLTTLLPLTDKRVRGSWDSGCAAEATYFHDKRSLKHMHRARSSLLGSHAATQRLDSPRSPIDHALKKCVRSMGQHAGQTALGAENTDSLYYSVINSNLK